MMLGHAAAQISPHRSALPLAALLVLVAALPHRPHSEADEPAEAESPAIAEIPDEDPAYAEFPFEERLADASSGTTLILLQSDARSPERSAVDSTWAERWRDAADRGGGRFVRVTSPRAGIPRESLRRVLSAESAQTEEELWIVLIGDATERNGEPAFCLEGKPLTAADLADELRGLRRPVAIVQCVTGLPSWLPQLDHPGRVMLCATNTGDASGPMRWGDILSKAIADPIADSDRDGQTTLWEAAAYATQKMEESYHAEALAPAEKIERNDQGDRDVAGASGKDSPLRTDRGLGSLTDQFCLVRSEEERRLSASVRRQRHQLERQIVELKARKATFEEDAYFDALETLLVRIAELNGLEPTAVVRP